MSKTYGVVLVNLGTPCAPTAEAIKEYLQEFLSDPYVVQLPAWLWQPLLRYVILPKRSQRLVESYQMIWQSGDSPLRLYMQELAAKLEFELQHESEDEDHRVVVAMRYGQPSLQAAYDELQALVDEVIVMPLYPQYSMATTLTVTEKIKELNWQKPLKVIESYHNRPGYINALASTILPKINQHFDALLLMSFHGLPQKMVKMGDPYEVQCHETATLLAEKLGLTKQQWAISFQSRFGLQKWLQPYTHDLLTVLPKKGIKKVYVVCPGFSVECLETLEEINEQSKAMFLAVGGEFFEYIPALNDLPEHVEMLKDMLHSVHNNQ
ncbi:Ferrochelatase [Piscirickettsia salmonis]|uniref:Ferrochelatase n=1 Tax=Piscirickettsia salmonis TaxID=1238 RepID=A0A1L6TBR6_PISSA|nr:ferrochelatase [Piscirickettsia salmonis]ALB22783.1 ferrochelatase [Piscirickettsia salmonis]ALT18403.1 ferrochelatase [Piscirickettsia salmonis LF-89 = ATCC VR-1361]ALY02772.1 ferrochelatase [Piscirickettsia salmonis]AMA42320.1 ferrochelatase [Piscirickettsia salmonis]AOS34794.1 ferrochelatase [Piscirickettsia salmonis]